MIVKIRHLGYVVVIAGILVVCWSCKRMGKDRADTLSRRQLIISIEKALNTLDDFRGTVVSAGSFAGKPIQGVCDVVSKGESLLYVQGDINHETSLLFVSKGETTWRLTNPGGKLERMSNHGAAVLSHPSMQSFLSGLLYVLKSHEFCYSAKRSDDGRIQITIKATDPAAEWVYELDSKTFYVIKQHAHGPHGTADATWTTIDVKSTVPRGFFDTKLDELKKMAAHDSSGRDDAQPSARGNGIPSPQP